MEGFEYTTLLLIEATVVGLLLVVLGTITKRLLPTVRMEIVLFVTGAITHLAFELAGVNKNYCSSGAACRHSIPKRKAKERSSQKA